MYLNGLKRILIFCLLFLYPAMRSIAQNNTLYFLYNIHQSLSLNPSYQSSCNGYLALPAISGITFNAANSGFSFKDIFHPGTGNLSDSLVIDIDKVKSKLGNSNNLVVSAAVPIFGLGFWIRNYYFTFDITNKEQITVGYPGNLIKLTEGNGNYIGADNPLIIKDFAPEVTSYQEYAFGLSKRITHRLFVGARFKILQGNFNMDNKKSEISLITDQTTYALHLKTNIDYRLSGPITVNKDSTGAVSDFSLQEINRFSDVFTFQNFGLAIDLGAHYQFNDNLRFYASVTDLGFIRWNKNTHNIKQNAQFDFSGLSLDSVFANSNYDELNSFADSLTRFSKFEENLSPYTSYLYSNIYLGASYDIENFMNFGVLSKSYFLNHKIHQAFILSANFMPVKWFTGSLSYSIANRSFNNLGAAIAVNFGGFQIFMLTDNLNGAFWPKGTRAIGFQFGVNLNFGCGKRDDYSIMNNKKYKKDIDFM